jgi:hypothetical protein
MSLPVGHSSAVLKAWLLSSIHKHRSTCWVYHTAKCNIFGFFMQLEELVLCLASSITVTIGKLVIFKLDLKIPTILFQSSGFVSKALAYPNRISSYSILVYLSFQIKFSHSFSTPHSEMRTAIKWNLIERIKAH